MNKSHGNIHAFTPTLAYRHRGTKARSNESEKNGEQNEWKLNSDADDNDELRGGSVDGGNDASDIQIGDYPPPHALLASIRCFHHTFILNIHNIDRIGRVIVVDDVLCRARFSFRFVSFRFVIIQLNCLTFFLSMLHIFTHRTQALFLCLLSFSLHEWVNECVSACLYIRMWHFVSLFAVASLQSATK